MSEQHVTIHAEGVELEGALSLPASASGLVIFVHGSGSSRLSPRNAFVAREIQRAGIGTLLFDLLTPQEDEDPRARFDIDLLAERLRQTLSWVRSQAALQRLRIGLFGASTGAAAALRLAAQDAGIAAVVSRGGRTDLADADLPRVTAPTLLIVGGADTEVLELNRQSFERLACTKELSVVEDATHLFEEPGALERVAARAATWFETHLG